MPWCRGGHFMDNADNYCAECGKGKITKCVNNHQVKDASSGGQPKRPNHCTICGAPFPWASVRS